MRCVLQRVSSASVKVNGEEISSVGKGLLLLLGVGKEDGKEDAIKLAEKIVGLRIFTDSEGKFNLSLADVKGEVLVVSQFTLFANCRKGRRPGFDNSAPPALAEPLYEFFCDHIEKMGFPVGRGVFGAVMEVSLVNDGPVTIFIDTDEWKGN